MAAKKLSKPAIIAIVIVAVLLIAFAIFLPLYLKSNKSGRDLYNDQKIKITAFGETVGEYTLEQLLAIDGVESKDFSAVYDTSNSEPVTKSYKGIEVKQLLSALNVDLYAARTFTFVASDGANKLYSYKDVVTDPDNVYIAYKVEGLDFHRGIDGLGYTRTEEDGGPYVIIKRSDVFSQNRCKLFVELIVQ